MKFIIVKIIKIFIIKDILRRQFWRVRCNVCNSYLNVRSFVRVNWFRRVVARARAILHLSGQRLCLGDFHRQYTGFGTQKMGPKMEQYSIQKVSFWTHGLSRKGFINLGLSVRPSVCPYVFSRLAHLFFLKLSMVLEAHI